MEMWAVEAVLFQPGRAAGGAGGEEAGEGLGGDAEAVVESVCGFYR